MMSEYKIVDGNNVTELSKWVNLLLREGWELRGDMYIVPETEQYKRAYYQVMTRETLNPNRIIPN